jgi:hypothetical protein
VVVFVVFLAAPQRPGLNLEHVKEALRHRSIRSTEVYAEVSPAARAAHARVMESRPAIVKVRP